MQDVQIQYRPKIKSLEGVRVTLHTMDGVPVEPPITLLLEEVSPMGFLFRSDTDGALIYTSSASFRAVNDDG